MAFARVKSGTRGLLLSLTVLLAGCQPPESARQERSPADSAGAAAAANDRLILAAVRVALPPPGVTAYELPDPNSAGAKHIARFCSRCHNLPSPTIHSATDWPSVVRRMWLRMDQLPPEFGVPVPTSVERQAMLAYLTENALRVSGANLPQGPGRQVFSQVCSQCHSLPDPRQHSPNDWPSVATRMERRMEQMRVNRPAPGQMQEILSYLRLASTRTR